VTLQESVAKIRKPLGNVRPKAQVIRARGDMQAAESHESLQDQIDQLQAATLGGLSSLISTNTGDIVNPGVTVHGAALTY